MRGLLRHTQDDGDATSQSIQSIDYLSHCWVEEDIWTSRRYVISEGRDLPERGRLENASWRLWAKIRNDFGTILPSAIKW